MPALRNEGEFHSLPHGVDAVGANVHAVAKVPFEGTWFSTPPAPCLLCPLPAIAAPQSHNGVVALAVDASCARSFLEGPDR